ncbi:hypothetical protein BDGGKGIB_00711 [Nodularia sphaerocarpa UHCC 0038]|nr:hypothetical protein BDGGKGIB_00711 [Nodularia sphaerocarpa UHCC 0038]
MGVTLFLLSQSMELAGIQAKFTYVGAKFF